MSCGDLSDFECAKIQAALDAFVDNEECGIERALMEAHFALCDDCSDEWHRELILKAMVARSCCAEPAPMELRVRILSQIIEIREGH